MKKNSIFLFFLFPALSFAQNTDLGIISFLRSPSSYAFPKDFIEADSLAFYADVINYNNEDVENIRIRLSVYESTETFLIYEDFSDWQTMFALDTTRIFLPNKWKPNNLEYLNYKVVYQIENEGGPLIDENLENNQISYPFRDTRNYGHFGVSGEIFKDDCEGFSVVRPDSLQEWYIANIFEIPEGGPYNLSSIEFSLYQDPSDGSIEGQEILIIIYEVDPTIDSDFSNLDTASPNANFIPIGFGTFEYSSESQNGEPIAVSVFEIIYITHGINLEGGRYLAMMVFENQAQNLYQVVDTSQIYPQPSSLAYFDNQWHVNPFGTNVSPIIRLNGGCLITNIDEVEKEEALFSLYPNQMMENLR